MKCPGCGEEPETYLMNYRPLMTVEVTLDDDGRILDDVGEPEFNDGPNWIEITCLKCGYEVERGSA